MFITGIYCSSRDWRPCGDDEVVPQQTEYLSLKHLAIQDPGRKVLTRR